MCACSKVPHFYLGNSKSNSSKTLFFLIVAQDKIYWTKPLFGIDFTMKGWESFLLFESKWKWGVMTLNSPPESTETSSICGIVAKEEISSQQQFLCGPAHNSNWDESELFTFFTYKWCTLAFVSQQSHFSLGTRKSMEYIQKFIPINIVGCYMLESRWWGI